MKRSRRWREMDLKLAAQRRGGVHEVVVVPDREGEHRAASISNGTDTEIKTAYPPSSNHSKFRSGKLRPSAIEYRRSIGWLYRAAGGKRLDGPVSMEVELYKPAVNVPYDADNALQNILNGLKGIAYRDDDQVTLLTVAKMWPEGNGRAVIRVKKIAPASRPAL